MAQVRGGRSELEELAGRGRSLDAFLGQQRGELVVAVQHFAQLAVHVPHHFHVVAHITQWRIDLVRDAGDHLAERGHFLALHQGGLRGLELAIRFGEFGGFADRAVLHRAQQVQHHAHAGVLARAREHEILRDRRADVGGDVLCRPFQRGIGFDPQGLGVHHLGDRATAPQFATEAVQEDLVELVTAERADGHARFDHRNAQQLGVLGGQHALGRFADRGLRRQRRHFALQSSDGGDRCGGVGGEIHQLRRLRADDCRNVETRRSRGRRSGGSAIPCRAWPLN